MFSKAIKVLLPLALFATPASANLAFPSISALAYCDARAMGMGYKESIRVAVKKGWLSGSYINESQNKKNALKMARLIRSLCPQYAQPAQLSDA